VVSRRRRTDKITHMLIEGKDEEIMKKAKKKKRE